MSVRQALLPADFSASALTLPLSAALVTGTLRRGEAPAAAEPLLFVSTADGATVAKARTDDRGGFVVPYVPPGTYSLVAGQRPLQTFAVPQGGTVPLGMVPLSTL